MSKWIPSWVNYYRIAEKDATSFEVHLSSSYQLGYKPISEYRKDTAISDVCQQMREKPLSERVEKDVYIDFSEPVKRNKYHREIRPNMWVDVYHVLAAFTGKINEKAKPAVDHAIKKLLAPGLRGVKEERQDLIEARDSLNRAIQQLDEWA